MKKDNAVEIIINIILYIVIISIAISFLQYLSYNPNDNFEKTKKEFQSGNYSVIIDLHKDYYIRPDFYPNYNSNERYNARKAIYGYGVYPSDITYSTNNISINQSNINQSIDVYTLIFASTGVYTYQGIKLSIISPNEELFETYIIPENILLSPKYSNDNDNSIYNSNSLNTNITTNWAYKLKMTIVPKKDMKDIPKGEYIFKLKTGNPSPETDMEYNKEVNKVNGTYISGSPIQPSKLFDFILKIK